MSRYGNLDDLMREWVDIGEDRLPLDHLYGALAEIERTRQRGARWALLEEIAMRMQPLAVPLAIGALLVAAVGAFAIVSGTSNSGAPDNTPTARAHVATPSPSTVTADDLDSIAFTEEEVIMGLSHDESREGVAALIAGVRAEGDSIDSTGFVDARFNVFSGLVNHCQECPATIGTYAALFATTADAERAYREMREEHESMSGWSLEPEPSDPSLGDEGVSYSGAAWDRDSITMYLWRSGRMVLATIGLDGAERIDVLGVARRMDDRAD